MGIPADLQLDVQRLFDAHNANSAQVQVDEILGGYTDGLSSDGTRFIALCFDFGVGSKELKLLHFMNLQTRIVPLGKDNRCPMDVFGFASNTTNANWSHTQNKHLAEDRMDETMLALARNGVPVELVSGIVAQSGELGPEDLEDPDERFSMVVVTLNGASPPSPLPTP